MVARTRRSAAPSCGRRPTSAPHADTVPTVGAPPSLPPSLPHSLTAQRLPRDLGGCRAAQRPGEGHAVSPSGCMKHEGSSYPTDWVINRPANPPAGRLRLAAGSGRAPGVAATRARVGSPQMAARVSGMPCGASVAVRSGKGRCCGTGGPDNRCGYWWSAGFGRDRDPVAPVRLGLVEGVVCGGGEGGRAGRVLGDGCDACGQGDLGAGVVVGEVVLDGGS